MMSGAQEEHNRKVNIGNRKVTSLRFADEIDALACLESTGAIRLS